MTFTRKKVEASVVPVSQNNTPPTVLDDLRGDLQKIEDLIKVREDEITTLNVRAVELQTQIAWLSRTPQAIVILTALSKRYAGGSGQSVSVASVIQRA
jgi:hypothetical protein